MTEHIVRRARKRHVRAILPAASEPLTNDSYVSSKALEDEFGISRTTLRNWANPKKPGGKKYVSSKLVEGMKKHVYRYGDVKAHYNREAHFNDRHRREMHRKRAAPSARIFPSTGLYYVRSDIGDDAAKVARDQLSFFQLRFPHYRGYVDVGCDGADEDRQQLKQLLDHVETGTVIEVLVTSVDCLATAGITYIQWYLKKMNVPLRVVRVF